MAMRSLLVFTCGGLERAPRPPGAGGDLIACVVRLDERAHRHAVFGLLLCAFHSLDGASRAFKRGDQSLLGRLHAIESDQRHARGKIELTRAWLPQSFRQRHGQHAPAEPLPLAAFVVKDASPLAKAIDIRAQHPGAQEFPRIVTTKQRIGLLRQIGDAID